MLPLLLALAMGILTGADSVATATVRLRTIDPPQIDAYAYYMSAGPLGPVPADFVETEEWPRAGASNLRVTMHNCERSWWLTIDEIIVRRADTRTVVAQYGFRAAEQDSLLMRVKGAASHMTRAGEEPIVWLSPTAFEYVLPRHVMLIEHLRGPEFRVTVRTRER